jgi:prophage tail gpP-like protein
MSAGPPSRSCAPSKCARTASCTEAFPDNPSQIIAQPGSKCTVTCGKDTVVTGYVDRYEVTVGPAQHDVVVQGRGLCQDLTDCSADLLSADSGIVGGMINASSTLDLATRLAKPFNITAKSIPTDLGKPIPSFQVAIGETPYEIIERAARYAGFLVYEDETGTLILDQVGTKAMASGFAIPGNVEGAHSELSIDQRFSSYAVVWSTVDQLSDLGQGSFQRAVAVDKTMPRYRPHIFISEQIVPDFDIATARANWEMGRRLGRSQAITLTCDSWRDTAGALWKPNMLASINAPALKIVNANWIIGTVTYRKDESGTHADLVLMPPDAFKPEPSPLQLFDRELTHAVPTSQSPAPTSLGHI